MPAVAWGADDVVTNVEPGPTGVIGTSIRVVPSPGRTPRCTVTPHPYSTTDHSTTTGPGVDASVCRTNSIEVASTSRPMTCESAGSPLSLRTENIRKDAAGSTAEMATVWDPSATLTAWPDWTPESRASKQAAVLNVLPPTLSTPR